MSYPEYALIDGKKYKINTDYRVALRCFDVINDTYIGDYERAMAIIYLLFGLVPDEKAELFFDKARFFLQCGEIDNTDGGAADMDLVADKNYIFASFMSDYRIDLDTTQMHFWKFIDLIKGLTENCVLSKVREIRNYDLSEIKDSKYRGKILKAKEAVKLPVYRTKEEQATIDEFENLFKGE